MEAIEVVKLKKRYSNGVLAVNNVSFTIKKGEIFGLLGPNGAGKTTILKVLTTLLQPTSGKVNVLGFARTRDDAKIRGSIGYVPQDISSDPVLTGYENLLISAKLYGKTGAEAKKIAEEILVSFELTEAKDRMVRTYSGGMIRKLETGQAMVHKPHLLLLDEPTVGLDPKARKQVWTLIQKLKKETDMTIIVTTHYMEEADMLCDRVAIMSYGKISVINTPTNLKKAVGKGAVILTVKGQLPEIPNMIKQDDSIIIPSADPETELPKYVIFLKDQGCEILSARTRDITLDDAFLKFAGTSVTDTTQWQSTRKIRRIARRLE